MIFSELELRYLATQKLGRLATIGPDGAPQNKPVAFTCNTDDGTIDIGGRAIGASQKFRNVQRAGRVSFVVDDVASEPWQGRGVEIRGHAEALTNERPSNDSFSAEIIRIHPRRVVAWGLESTVPAGRPPAPVASHPST